MAIKPFRILFFGDVVARPGRAALAGILPVWKKKYKADAVIANVENLTHGKGITKKALDEILAAGVDYCTSGNHVLSKDGEKLLADPSTPVLRPANFPDGTPGRGDAVIQTGKFKLLVVSLIGTTFFRDGATYANPFPTADAILQKHEDESLHAVLVDWHAEATSEKVALGWHLDGRVSAVLGTHTHVPTADLRILPEGTAYRSDVGMTGLRDGILGVDRDIILHNFLHPEDRKSHQWSDHGTVQIHAVLLEVDPKTRKTTRVQALDHEMEL